MVAHAKYGLNTTEEAAATDALIQSSSIPESGNVTVDNVLKLVAQNPGASSCTYWTLKRIWVSLCAYISDQLLKVKGVTIPGFASLSFRKLKVDRGNWGEKLDLVPTCTLHPNFRSLFSLATSRTMASGSSGAVGASPANLAAIAIKAGVGKDACQNALKDICRKFGDIAAKGGTFTVDFGISRLLFKAQRCEVQWNSAFLKQIERHCTNINNKALSKVGKGKSTQKAYTADSLAPRDVDLTQPESMPGKVAISSRLPSPARNPHAHPAAPGQGAFNSAPSSRPSSAGVRLSEGLKQADGQGVSQVRSHLHEALAFARQNTAARDASPSPAPQSINVPSPSPSQLRSLYNNLDEYGTTGQHTACGRQDSMSIINEKYAKRLRNKATFRRMRNKAYAVAWEEQTRARHEQERKEKQYDAVRMRVTREQEDLRRRRAEQEVQERKALAKRVQMENLTASSERKARPDAHPVGDRFWGREEVLSPRKDGSVIRDKIEALQQLKRAREAASRKDDLDALEMQSKQWQQEERREKDMKRREKEALLNEYQTYMQEKCSRAAGYSPHIRMQYTRNPTSVLKAEVEGCKEGGNFFFKSRSVEQMADDEQKERDDRRQAAMEVQRENQRIAEQGMKKKKVHNGIKKYSDKRHIDKSMIHEMAVNDDELLDTRRTQEELRRTWDTQIREKREARQRERARDQSASTMHAWRNESSDEEYDDFQHHKVLHSTDRDSIAV